jgi:tetratricopeptide (TPR) repeat protein
MLRAAPEMATCSKCGFVMDERTRPPKCPRCATPTQPATFTPPGATRTGAPPGGRPRNLEPVGAPPVFGGAAPTTGTASGQTLYGLPMPDDGDELTMLGGDDSGPLDETRKTSGPPTIDSSESSGQFDAAALFGEVDLASVSADSLELDLPGLSGERTASSRPTSRELPPLVDDDDVPFAPSVARPPSRPTLVPPPGTGDTTRPTKEVPQAPKTASRPPTAVAPTPARAPVPSVPPPAAPPRPPTTGARPPSAPSAVPPPAPRRPGPQGAPPIDLPTPSRPSGPEGFGAQSNLPTPARPSGGGFGGPAIDLPVPARPSGPPPAFPRAGGPPPSPPAYGGPGGPVPRTGETPSALPRVPASASHSPGFDDEMISVADLDLPSPIDLDLPAPAGAEYPAPVSHSNLPMPAAVDLLAPASLDVEPANILPAPANLDLEPARSEVEPARAEVKPVRGANVPVPRAIATNASAATATVAPETTYDPLGARRSPTPRDVGGGSSKRPLILAAIGLALAAAVGGGMWAIGLFDPPADEFTPQSLGNKKPKDTKAPVDPSTLADERNADVVAAFAKHTPKAYVEAIALAEAAGDRVGQAEAALRLHMRYGPDAVRRGQAETWLEQHTAQADPHVQRVVGLSALARGDLAKAEPLLVGDDPATRLYRGWLRLAQGRAADAAVEADAILVAAPADVAGLALRHEAKAELDAAGELAGIEASLGKHPGHPGLTLLAARSAIAAGQLKKARGLLDGLGTPEGTGQGYAAGVLRVRGALDDATGAPGKAALRYAEALAFAPEDTTLGPARVRSLMKAKRTAEATSDAAAIVKARPTDVDAALLQAEVAIESGEGDAALAMLDAIEKTSPGRAQTPYLRGRVYAGKLKIVEAQKEFAAALAIDSKLDDARIAEAEALATFKDFENALKAFDRAIKVVSDRPGGDPKNQVRILRAKAAVLASHEVNQKVAALAALDRALELVPNDNEAQLARGLLQFELGKLAECKADLLAVYERAGRYSGLTGPLGRIFVHEGAIKELEELVGGALEEPETTNEELVVGARLRLAQGKPDETKTLAERVLTTDVNNWEAHLLLAAALAESGDYVGALAEIDRCVPPSSVAEKHLWRGKIMEFNGRHGEASPEYQKALAIDVDAHEARFLYGRLLSRAGNSKSSKAAEEHLLKVVGASDKWPAAWMELGRAQRDLGDRDASIKSLRTAIEKDDTLLEAHYLLGRNLYDATDKAGAAAALKKAVDPSAKDQPWFKDAEFWLGKAKGK